MTEPIRIRARVHDGITDVQILMPHPMETGMRQDEAHARLHFEIVPNISLALR